MLSNSPSLSWWLLAAVPVAWLVPNHYLPWTAAWSEFVALALLCAAGLAHPGRPAWPWPWAAALALALASVALQWATGRIVYGGDALLAALYLVALGGAIAFGREARLAPAQGRWNVVDGIAAGLLAAALLSVATALLQWASIRGLGVYVPDLAPGARPHANVAQPNHFCTISFLGLAAAGLLRARGHLGPWPFGLTAAYLLLGMVMSGSRTAWLQMLLLLAAAGLIGRAPARPLALRTALALVAGYAVLAAAWTWLNRLLLNEGTRSLAQQAEGGARLPAWRVLADAVLHEPWAGHGWQQVGLALQAAALDHPPVQRLMDRSHNLVLDLLLWAGIPVGLALIALGAAALVRLARRCDDVPAAWMLVGIFGVLAHAMVEYPLEYAYFLLPVGVLVGAAHAAVPVWREVRLPAWPWRPAWGAMAVLLALLAADYLRAEQDHRMMRLETARIGVATVSTEVPDLRLLDQLEALLRLARNPAREGMSPAEMQALARAARRWAYPPALLRHAIAAGLNGQPEEASRSLRLICRIHSEDRCAEARTSWRALQGRYDALKAIPPP